MVAMVTGAQCPTLRNENFDAPYWTYNSILRSDIVCLVGCIGSELDWMSMVTSAMICNVPRFGSDILTLTIGHIGSYWRVRWDVLYLTSTSHLCWNGTWKVPTEKG